MDKNDAKMTKGLGILCMLTLHLFCRTGKEVLGTPLIWVNTTTPLVYYLGFFAEICIPLYSMSAGYARQMMMENKKVSWKSNMFRILKLLVNYWIVLFVFCAVGLIFKHEFIPGNAVSFIKSIFLLHSYNGAWWFLNTYIILLLIPVCITLFPLKKLKNPWMSFAFCFCVDVLWFLLFRFNILSNFNESESVLSFIGQEAFNLIGVLPYFWAGAFLCKYKTIDCLKNFIDMYIPQKFKNSFLLSTWGLLFILTVIIHKAVLSGAVAFISFIIFNLIRKNTIVEKAFMFLGKHSTNIWLTHLFFCSIIFKKLFVYVKYPLFILLLLLLLCITTSYLIMGTQYIIYHIPIWLNRVKKG